jgi:predicted DNA-binding mobile mystery protein A
MKTAFKELRLKQLDRTVAQYPARSVASRPRGGWVRAVRQALGVSAAELARTLGTSRQLPLQLEKAEAGDSITLRSLRNAANALDCDLVYALVPKSGTMQELGERRVRAAAKKHVLKAEHSMAIEDQAAGDVEAAVATEVRRRAKGNRA